MKKPSKHAEKTVRVSLTPHIATDILLIIAIVIFSLLVPSLVSGQQLKTRVKDVARFEGIESYSLVGYGLVIGLNGTGDSDQELTQQTINNVLQNFNLKVNEADLKASNVAAVMITLEIRDSSHKGDLKTATVATIGDATSLMGGELLLAPLLGTDGTPWAIAQGPVTIGGFTFGDAGAGGDQQSKNHPTVGKLANGVKMLRDINVEDTHKETLMVFLNRPDYTTAVNLADAINLKYFGSSRALNRSTVKVMVPRSFLETATVPVFISEVEQILFTPDSRARIVFSERTGTIVIGRDVRLTSVAISHGSISVNIKSSLSVSQPNSFRSGGDTKVIENQETQVIEEATPLNVLPSITSIGDLVDVLNTLGVTPRDIMAIFIALQESGALHAEIDTM